MEMVRLKCGFVNGIDIASNGLRGGLSLGWTGSSLVSLRSYSQLHVDVDIHDNENGETWRFTRFYENPDERYKRSFWELLWQLDNDPGSPWIVLGDFNEITSSFEKKGGRLRSERQMADFCNALEDCRLNDLGYVGQWFTWERGRFRSTNIRERLDRGVTSLNWMNLFPSYSITHLSHSFSDHCPVFMNTVGNLGRCESVGNKLFRFEAKWCLDESFEAIVQQAWADPLVSVPDKLANAGKHFQF
ncbi:hypothetical protein CXB51_002739 [Gossypium anomalum]|uniref:Endonuclease/exonuclease/phosphatase domain-containing protein n=1 Tax=Gossypium anomalum TaxID=47600 RepID=A0A8J6D6M5_9ROSI|nr:hypothetical protein CXB51_002739 [Gossypium anomalum]